MIRRPPRSTQSRSSAASDVYKRQVELPGALGQAVPEAVNDAAVLELSALVCRTEGDEQWCEVLGAWVGLARRRRLVEEVERSVDVARLDDLASPGVELRRCSGRWGVRAGAGVEPAQVVGGEPRSDDQRAL